MNNEEKRKQFLDSIEDDHGSWLEEARYRRENRTWLRKSQRIALRILQTLDEKNMQQKELAEAMGVSPQQVSKIVKGKQNLTLETISKLETVLGVKLFEVPDLQFEMNVDRKNARANLSKEKSTSIKSRKDLSEVSNQLWIPSSE